MKKCIEELAKLRIFEPDFADRIYAEIRAEANIYGKETEYERLMCVNRLILRGIPVKNVLEAVKIQKEDILEWMTQ